MSLSMAGAGYVLADAGYVCDKAAMLRDMCIVAIQLGSPTHFTHISQSKYII
jgi:hypothetical protein